jgi:hypothetical protein
LFGVIHCFSCGADLPDNLSYCLHCGVPLDEAPTVIASPRRSASRGRLGIGALLVGLPVLAGLLLVVTDRTSPPVSSSSAAAIVASPAITPTPAAPPNIPVPDRPKRTPTAQDPPKRTYQTADPAPVRQVMRPNVNSK